MAKLILIRHGQSEWNKKNIFTGWVDIPLSPEGIEEALKAGDEIASLPIDIIFTSTLIRGIMTALLAMNRHKSGKIPAIQHLESPEWRKINVAEVEATLIPVFCAWQLNERMYGKLQGMNKDDARKEFGVDQVKLWRRSFDMAPPDGESLKMTKERTLPYFNDTIVSELKKGKNVMISAHGNSLRSIVMDLDNLSVEEVLNLEIPTGKALIYEYNGKFRKEN